MGKKISIFRKTIIVIVMTVLAISNISAVLLDIEPPNSKQLEEIIYDREVKDDEHPFDRATRANNPYTNAIYPTGVSNSDGDPLNVNNIDEPRIGDSLTEKTGKSTDPNNPAWIQAEFPPWYCPDSFDTAGFGAANPTDITTVDGTEFWITDSQDDLVYHVNSTGSLIDSFDTASFGGNSIWGLTTINGSEFWLIDDTDYMVYHVNSTGSLIDQFDTSSFGCQYPTGITTYDGTEFWICDLQDDMVYHVNATGSLIDSFDTSGIGASSVAGLDTVNGSEFWLVEDTDYKVYHVNATGTLIDTFDIQRFGSDYPNGGTTAYGNEFWVVDVTDDEVYHILKRYPSGVSISNITFYWGHIDDTNWALSSSDPYMGMVWFREGSAEFHNITEYTVSITDIDESYLMTSNLPTLDDLNYGINIRFYGYDTNTGQEDDLNLDYCYFVVNYTVPDIVINEINFNPLGNDIGNEWIELYNRDSFAIEIDDWILSDNDGNRFVFPDLPDFPIDKYMLIHLSVGSNDTDWSGPGDLDTNGVLDLYLGYNTEWFENDTDDLILLNSNYSVIDYVAHGGDPGGDDYRAVTEAQWINGDYINTTQLLEGQTLGRDMNSNDTDRTADWENSTGYADSFGVDRNEIYGPSPGERNIDPALGGPAITDVSADPQIQNIGGNINITCNVIDTDGVNEVWVNVSLPSGGYINITMTNGSGDEWFNDTMYLIPGQYQYTIWANDNFGDWTKSNVFQFEIINLPPVLSSEIVIPTTGFIDSWFNFSVIYTDLDNHVPNTITVNITGLGVYDLDEVDALDTDYSDGKEYYYNATGFVIGIYDFHFAANDTIGDWIESGMLQFEVVNRGPDLTSGQVIPMAGYNDTLFNFTVIYTNLDNNSPDTFTVNITNHGIFNMREADSSDLDYTDGKAYYCDIQGFTNGTFYSFHFAANDSFGNWTETAEIIGPQILNSAPSLVSPGVNPGLGTNDTYFNFTVIYVDIDNDFPDSITLNLTGPSSGIYSLIETNPSDSDYTDEKQYYYNFSGLSIGSYSFHFAANDSTGLWALETSTINEPDVVPKSGFIDAKDCIGEYSDVIDLYVSLFDSNSVPIQGERISFYIDINKNGTYEAGEYIGSQTTQVDGNASMSYINYLSPDTYNYVAIYNGSGYIIQDDEAMITIIAEQATLTTLSGFVEEGELISLAATLIDDDSDPVSGEDVAFYIDRNKNGIYEASEFIGLDTTSASGIASIPYTVDLSPENYGLWAKYEGSPNYMVNEIEGQLTVENIGNNPPTILGFVPDQIKPEDSFPWMLDLTSYEGDIEDSGADLKWYLTGVNNSLYNVVGMNSTDDVLTFILLENAYGNDEVTLWLEDSSSALAFQVLWINITPVNDLPYFDPKPPDLFVHYDDPGIQEDDPTPWNYAFYVHDIETSMENLIITTSEPEVGQGDGYAEVDGLNVTYHYPKSRVNESILVTLSLSDGTDIAQTIILLDITSDWVPELIRKLPDVILEENTTAYNVFDLDDYFTDKDHDILFYSSGYFHIQVVINENHTVDITALGEWTGTELATFRAKDPIGAIVEDTITVTVIPVNDEPVIAGVPDLVVHFDYSYAFDLSPYITDADNPPSELRVTTSESLGNIWIHQDDNMRMVINYPESMNGSTILVTIYVSDGIDTTSQQIQVTVSNDFPPELIYKLPDISFYEDSVFINAFNLDNYFLDIDGDILYYTNGTKSITVTINSNSTVDFSAPENWHGFEFVTFRATDPTGALAEDKILVVVMPVNDAPTIENIPRQEKSEGDQWVLDLSHYIDDVDNDISELTITIESEVGQDCVTLVGTILIFEYPKDIQTDIITITLSDGEHETQRSFSVNIKGSAKVAASTWDNLPWPLILLALFAVFGGVIVFYIKKNKYQVYEVFLIHKTGLFIAHKTAESTDMVADVKQSGMFMAGMTLIRDSFEDDDEITISEKLSVMGKDLIAGRGEELFILIVHTGEVKKRTLSEIKNVIERIEGRYGDILVGWDGDTEFLVGIEDYVDPLFK